MESSFFTCYNPIIPKGRKEVQVGTKLRKESETLPEKLPSLHPPLPTYS
jgi:hypothetical protein